MKMVFFHVEELQTNLKNILERKSQKQKFIVVREKI